MRGIEYFLFDPVGYYLLNCCPFFFVFSRQIHLHTLEKKKVC